MKIERCPKGHFFDGDRYDACPLCPPAPEPTLPPASTRLHLPTWAVPEETSLSREWGRSFRSISFPPFLIR